MKKKAIIIGGGVAGLSAGIYGQLNGYDTEILEMQPMPGGQCTSWKRKGYTFDYCIHWLFPGGGLPPSAQSGKWVIQMMARKDKKSFRVG